MTELLDILQKGGPTGLAAITGFGVYGNNINITDGSTGYGVWGECTSGGTGSRIGVYGTGSTYGVYGRGTTNGVRGEWVDPGGLGANGSGVEGHTTCGIGVIGNSTGSNTPEGSIGVQGISTSGIGGRFETGTGGAPLYIVPGTTPSYEIYGMIYYDSGTNKLRVYTNTGWQNCN